MHSAPIPPHLYATVVREHVWIISEDTSRLIEERSETGFAFSSGSEGGRTTIVSSDRFSALEPRARQLLGIEPSALTAMLTDTVASDESALLESFRRDEGPAGTFRVRTVRRARYVSNGRVDDAQATSWIVASREDVSQPMTIVCAEKELEEHRPVLMENGGHARSAPPRDLQSLPVLWSGGSASVLLHEAVGHPSERGIVPEGLPGWLSVWDRPDRPGSGAMRLDDCAGAAEKRNLSRGEAPSCFRRESFRSVPLRRMSNLFVEADTGAPTVELPARYLSIRIVSRGDFDPLTDIVRLTAAVADLVDGNQVTRLAPFTLEGMRKGICRSIAAAAGEALSYPGVLCSEDGQRLPVGSAAPIVLTLPFSES